MSIDKWEGFGLAIWEPVEIQYCTYQAALAWASVARAAPKYAAEHAPPQTSRMFRGPTASAKRPPTSVPKMASAAKAEKSWPTWWVNPSPLDI